MLSITNSTILTDKSRRTLAFNGTYNGTRVVRRLDTNQDVNMVFLSSNFLNTNSKFSAKTGKKAKNGSQSVTNEYSLSKLGDKYNVDVETKDTMTISSVCSVPFHFWAKLDNLKQLSSKSIRKMLQDRTLNSTKYYKELPSVIAKGLVLKYQKNRKCKSVKNVVLPISGDKGRVIKLTEEGIKIPSMFKKEIVPVTFTKKVLTIRGVEFFKRKGKWLMSLSYTTPTVKELSFSDAIGVDRNVRGNVITCCSGSKVVKLGQDVYTIKKNHRNRIGKLQNKKKFQLCKKLSGAQARRQKDINHKVSRAVVDLAKNTSSAIILENLSSIKEGKAGKFTKKSQWAYYQLDTFINYKAALSGIPVFYVSPRNTSKMCSKCGNINNPNGKQYHCDYCGHFDHRDANASFNIRKRFFESNMVPSAFHVPCSDDGQTITLTSNSQKRV